MRRAKLVLTYRYDGGKGAEKEDIKHFRVLDQEHEEQNRGQNGSDPGE